MSLLNITNSPHYASFAIGMACGAFVGYTLGESEGLLNNALLTTGCGVARAATRVLYDNPLRKELLLNPEDTSLRTKATVSNILDKGSLGFSIGVALGTMGSVSVLSGIFIQAIGLVAEALPVLVFSKPLRLELSENGTILGLYEGEIKENR